MIEPGDATVVIGAGTAAGAIVTSVLGYIAGRRRRSGAIATTDADKLWSEAREIRQQLHDGLSDCEAQNKQLRHDLDAATRTVHRLAEELAQVKAELGSLREGAA